MLQIATTMIKFEDHSLAMTLRGRDITLVQATTKVTKIIDCSLAMTLTGRDVTLVHDQDYRS